MAYRNKTYICFDADIDMKYYRLLQAWKENKKIDFTFSNAHELNRITPYSKEGTIKKKLRDRMENSRLLVVLIGEKTKNLYKYVKWEIELAIDMDIPIIAVNINKVNGLDTERCPPILKGKPVVHIPFSQEALIYATKYWADYYPKSKDRVDLFWEHLAVDK
jgi:hypothetical protein